jgi:crotonobetainyl-CoA:carnitine CoA-transferase CaiB-like acyl-CoA transferase
VFLHDLTHPLPAPAPRFDVDDPPALGAAPSPGADTDDVLAAAGFDENEINRLRSESVVG